MRFVPLLLLTSSLFHFSCSDDSQGAGGDGDGDVGDGDAGDGDGVSGDGDGVSGDGDGVSGDGDGDIGGGTSGDGDGVSVFVPEGTVPVFVGQGEVGRTVISCDDGRTWIHDQSGDLGEDRCFIEPGAVGCDHHEGHGQGLAYGNGQFFALFGWGNPSTLRQTSNGIDWDLRIPDSPDQRFGGVGYVDDTLWVGGISSRISTDDGLTWSDPIPSSLPDGSARRAQAAGGYFVIVADGGIAISDDKGQNWYQPDSLPGSCSGGIQFKGGIAYGNGHLTIVWEEGTSCSSTDGGHTFQAGSVGSGIESQLIWTGSDFLVIGFGNAYRSTNGLDWTSFAMNGNHMIGGLAVSDEGTYVAVEDGWGDSVWYEGQDFFRSEDGVNWDKADSYTGGHPMRHIVFGYADASENCLPD